MSETAPYAKVDGPPDWWMNAQVIDLDTGKEVEAVIEANASEGWIERWKTDPDGMPQIDPEDHCRILSERITGRFEIRRKT
jgi:hypothetical protein